MTTIIYHDESQSHKVLRKSPSTSYSDKEAFASSFTELRLLNTPENFSPMPYLAFTRTLRTPLHASESYPGSFDKVYCEIHRNL